MAIGRNCSSELKHQNPNHSNKKGLGFGNYTRTIGRKRIAVSSCLETSPLTSPLSTPPRKCYGRRGKRESSGIEALPQDILVRILCGVEHDDLKQLFHVSNTIREATTIAKQLHFAFSTPSSKAAVVKPFSDLEDMSKFEEAPNAPRQQRQYKSRFGSKKLAEISVALFAEMEI
ncbi:F-box protein At1g61340 [Magnolia sinica]|uniref:F-box protein At1g61340 n=1 Tax=Magnolia sinica TaxID=86752 RepID=UPI0026587A7A|nr:F-box protein At1g61340 [Magnolia sinica]